MKKTIQMLIALLFCCAVMSACSDKDDEINVVNPDPATDETVSAPSQQQTYTLTINATKGENAGLSKALSLSGTTLNATWKQGEVVAVYNGRNKIGVLTAQSDGQSTTLSGGFSGDNVPAVNDALVLKFNDAPDYSTQNGTLEYIAANCDYAVANVTVKEVIDGKITINQEYADFVNQQAIVKFTLKNSSGTELNATELKIKAGETTYEFTGSGEYYLALNGFSGTMILLATVGESKFQYYKESVSFDNGAFSNVNVKMQDVKSIAEATVQKNNVINADGNVYINIKVADFAGDARAAVVYVGEKSGYCTKCLAVGLEDISSGAKINGETNRKNGLDTYASNHAITVDNTTTYNSSAIGNTGYYDYTAKDTYKFETTGGLKKGWRLLLATDMFLIMGVNSNTLSHGHAYGNFTSLQNTINTACGNNSFSGTDYGTGTENKNATSTGTWHYSGSFWWADDSNSNYAYRYRAVFAW